MAEGYAVTLFAHAGSEYAGAFDPKDGTERWRFRIGSNRTGMGLPGGPTSTPLVSDGRAFALAPDGRLFALELASGALLWATDLSREHHATTPLYGFATSPVRFEGFVLVLTGGTQGNAVTAFEARTGRTAWMAGTDRIASQSPLLTSVAGRSQLLVPGNRELTGLDPETGRVLWSVGHDGDVDESGLGADSAHVVEGSRGRFLIKNKRSGSTLYRVTASPAGFTAERVWETPHLKNSYSVAVYHAGFFYGYDRYILSCVEEETGRLMWRSRTPHDGSLILIDGYLVTITKSGWLSIGPASPEGYQELAGLQLFADPVWNPASYAGGSLYLRSWGELARIDLLPSRSGH